MTTVPAFHLVVRGLRKSFAGVEVLHGVDAETRGGRVLALLGENGAGKSTMVKILAGDYVRDAGSVALNGAELELDSPRDAEAVGIRVIFQEFLDAPDLSVAENISLGRLPRRGGIVDWKAARRVAKGVLDQLGVDIDPDRPVNELGVAQRQIIEIARALAADARLLILDEPTSALAAEEVENLFRFVRRLRDQGVAVIYITHRLDEVAEIADDVVVFRDGRVVAAGPVAEFDQHALVEAMVGRQLVSIAADAATDSLGDADHGEVGSEQSGHEAVAVAGATLTGHFQDVSLSAYGGEVLSLFGRLGCGALELAEALFGLRRLDAGSVTVNGHQGQPHNPSAAIGRGVGFLPVDRKSEGLLTGLSASENLAVADWRRTSRFGVLSAKQSSVAYQRWADELRVVGRPDQPIETLSGGNQQKVLLGRWLEINVRALILAEPTRGVDVGARAEIYRVLSDLAAKGVAIVVVSSDIEEVLRISDRIAVFSRGRVVDVIQRADVNHARLTRAAAMKETA